MQILKSKEDKSVNFVNDKLHESRFVQRSEDYFIIYLSSQNGCNKSCRFCHLTQTGQTNFDDVSIEEYLEQSQLPLQHYDNLISDGQVRAEKVNFNFMARGEVFSNKNILNNSLELIDKLKQKAQIRNLNSFFNFSTIGPDDIKTKSFNDIFTDNQNITIYYSLYSVNPEFRKKWIPKGIAVEAMFEKLADWQYMGGKIALHWAFIEGINDNTKDIDDIIKLIDKYQLKAKFNTVRYNPFSLAQGRESSEQVIKLNFDKLANYLNNPDSRIVPRVGYDVKASCGMFVE